MPAGRATSDPGLRIRTRSTVPGLLSRFFPLPLLAATAVLGVADSPPAGCRGPRAAGDHRPDPERASRPRGRASRPTTGATTSEGSGPTGTARSPTTGRCSTEWSRTQGALFSRLTVRNGEPFRSPAGASRSDVGWSSSPRSTPRGQRARGPAESRGERSAGRNTGGGPGGSPRPRIGSRMAELPDQPRPLKKRLHAQSEQN